MTRDEALEKIRKEYAVAITNYKAFNSPHEGYAIIQEEVDELWDEIKKRPMERNHKLIHDEAIHVAAMALRFLTDIC